MKAVFFEQHGELEVLKYGDLPNPEPRRDEALIRVRAVALNHLDIWVRRGWKGLRLTMPHITGSDVAGEVVSVNGPSSWTPGMKVIVSPGIVTVEDEWTRRGEDSVSPGYKILGEQLPGGLAEYVCVPVASLYRMPDNLAFEEAAAPLLVATTCWRMLFRRAHLMPGETVLVVGAGGGVNSHAIQFARAAGAEVIVLAGSRDKAERALSLGAKYCIDYKETPRWDLEVLKLTRGRGANVVVDNVGTATMAKSLRAAARGGRIVTVGNTSGYEIIYDNRLLFTKQLSIIGSTMGSRQDFIDALEFMWSHNIKPVIDRVAPLKDAVKMLALLEEGGQFGKIVLRP